jgi:septation ring formation regulator EzrA
MKRIAIITLAAAALTSCASADLSQVSTLVLCDYVLNNDDSSMVRKQEAYLTELDSRGEDCSNLMHLRRPASSDINVNVEQ